MIQREFYLNKIKKVWDREEIKIITGVRRCGKTTILKQIITELKKREIKNENILYISFETAQYKK
ncbi:AAA family ATPase [Methanobrevibacter oralis]|nr:AAA family ATPase [Methanobrevibacter oralis]